MLSVAAVLFLLGAFIFISLHSNDIVDDLKEDFEAVVELKSDVSKAIADKVVHFLKSTGDVRPESVVFVSKEEGLEHLSKDLGGEILTADMPNPLADVITFSLVADHFEAGTFSELEGTLLKKFDAVSGVYYERGMIDQVVTNFDKLAYILLIGGLILMVLALTLIYNSIRLSLYANRFLVKNMELVGASWSFIRKPFLWKGVKHGFVSALISIIAMFLLGIALFERMPDLLSYLNGQYLLFITILLFGFGILINITSTFVVVTKFLRMSINDLH